MTTSTTTTTTTKIPELQLEDVTTNIEYSNYFTRLKHSLTREKDVRNRRLRFISDVNKVGGIVADSDFLKFVPFVYKEFKCIALFGAESHYFLGFMTEEVKSGDGSRPSRICYLIYEDIAENQTKINWAKACVTAHYKDIIIKFEVLGIGEDYISLEKLAGFKRSQISLGRKSLIEAIKLFSITDTYHLTKNLDKVAMYVIVIAQMFPESFRLKELGYMGCFKFEQGFVPPRGLIIREHGWSIASKSLQSQFEVQVHNHKLYYADVREKPLDEHYLHRTYDMLLPSTPCNKARPDDDFQKILTTKYVCACLGKFVKSLQVNFENTDEVTAMIHIFQEHVVLQYNHIMLPGVEVDVEVLPSNAFIKLESDQFLKDTLRSTFSETQPLEDTLGRTFVAFKLNELVPKATFSSNWKEEKKEDAEKSYPTVFYPPELDVLEMKSKDFFRSVGNKKFYETRETLKSKDGSYVYNYIHQTLFAEKTLDQATTELEGLFNMKVEHDQVNPKGRSPFQKAPGKKPSTATKAKRNVKLIYGKYLNKFEVFVAVTFTLNDETKLVQKTELSVVCEGLICNCVIVDEILKDWKRV